MKYTMRLITSLLNSVALLWLMAFSINSTSAQAKSPINTTLGGVTAIGRKMTADQRAHLSTGANNLLFLAESGAMNRVNASHLTQQAVQQLLEKRNNRTTPVSAGPVPVNGTDFDFLLSRLAGFTQNGSSNAWCGQDIVVGYNDSEALLFTSAVGTGASASGVAVSHDAGGSFRGSLFLNAGTDPSNFLGGEPVVACSGKNFYYASLFEYSGPIDPQTGLPRPIASVAVNRSRDGGDSWSAPLPAVRKNADEHIVDKEWLTIDPKHPDNLYISYTDFDFTFSKANGCDGGSRVAIELVSSNNGGLAWSRPVVVDQMCSPVRGQALQGSQVVVGNAGEVFVAWVSATPGDEQIFFRRSIDGGATFSDAVMVGDAILAGLAGNSNLQGLVRGNSFPSLSIDRSGGASRGTLYLTWTDASRNQIPDFLAPLRRYGFGDVVFSQSTDKGTIWTPAKVVRPAHNAAGSGRDQFLPSVAVDSEGTLAICYFDRRRDAENNGVDHYCSVSHDQGANFTEIRQTQKPWAPTHSNDGLTDPISVGDYDGVSTDASGANPGFFSTFQMQPNGNPDIFGARF